MHENGRHSIWRLAARYAADFCASLFLWPIYGSVSGGDRTVLSVFRGLEFKNLGESKA